MIARITLRLAYVIMLALGAGTLGLGCKTHSDAGAAPPAQEPPGDLIKVAPARVSNHGATLRLFGRLGFEPGAAYAVRAPLSGFARTVDVALGQEVKKGDRLATISSKDAAEVRADLARAAAELRLAKTNLERLKSLKADGAATDREVREAEAKLTEEEADFARASAAAAALGVGGGSSAAYEIRASAAGWVVARNIHPGERVGPDDAKEAFLIGDITRLEVTARAYERDIAEIELNEPARIEVPSIPGAVFNAKVTYLGQVIDPVSRTVPVRLALDAPDKRLRAEMTATVSLDTVGTSCIVVPRDAILLKGDAFVVLVKKDDGGYERRKVRPGVRVGDDVQLLEGLKPNENVVVAGAVLVDGELDRILAP